MENQVCSVCYSKEIHPLVQQDQYYWQICKGCGFAFISNLSPEDEVNYGSDERGSTYIGFYGNKYKSKMRRAHKRARHIKKLMNGPRILDVGCNLGYFVEACRLLGLDSTGTEVNPVVVKQAGIMFPESRFECGVLSEINIGNEKFDAIHTSEVIEHVIDINDFMSGISERLVSGGVLYLTTPELKKFKSKQPDKEWNNLKAPNHRQYFSRNNITIFLEKHGYRDIKFERNWNFKPGIKLTARKTT